MARVSQNFAALASNTLRPQARKILLMKSANQILAENLKRIMDERGLSNTVLGQESGLAPNTIKNYKVFDPTRSAKLGEVELLAKALKVSLIELLTEHKQSEVIQPDIGKPEKQMLLDLQDLTPRRQSQLFDMIHQEAESVREAVAHHEKRKTTTAAEKKPTVKASTTAAVRSEHPRQRALPLRTVGDPFRAEPGEREAALYDRIERSPKA